VDRAPRPILRQKLRLGLFERPLVDPERASTVVHARKHLELALRAAFPPLDADLNQPWGLRSMKPSSGSIR
jgi:hypothetical protein